MGLRLVTVNRHTGYLYLMAKLGYEFLVVGGEDWGHMAQRPLPPNVVYVRRRLKTIDFREVLSVIGHDPLWDLLTLGLVALKHRIPYIQIFHGRIERSGYYRTSVYKLIKKLYRHIALKFVQELNLATFVFISETVRRSWGLEGAVIYPGIPVDEMMPYTGNRPVLLVVGNDLHREHFDFDLLCRLRTRLPVLVVGRNPRIPDSKPAGSWEDLRKLYSECRAYLNITREPEDGYNLATLEAMASGMPVITLKHPTSPIRDGFNGMVGGDLWEIQEKATLLLNDVDLARYLGQNARRTVLERFSIERFTRDWESVIRRRRDDG
ncbi:MAG: hypothetical protein C4291_15410 [Candidatus Dadabacteria bacterium]